MAFRPIVPLLMAANATHSEVVSALSLSSSRRLRGSSQAGDSGSMTRGGVLDIADTRSLQEDATTVEENTPVATEEDTATVEVPVQCLDLLLASANEYGKLKEENYFVFTDNMSNGWYTFNNMTSYDELPMENKFGYITLTCQCRNFGGKEDCCQGDGAKIDVSGMGDPESMTIEMQTYVNNICSVTSKSIGQNVMPFTSEPTTAKPTTSTAPTLASVTSPPTINPTLSISPTVVPSEGPTISPAPGPTEVVTVKIPTNCLNLLAASANENNKLGKENYFVFTDGMSNGYYTANNMTEYSDLPLENKFAYVTLTCRCRALGGRDNCCQGDRAKLDVTGIDELESMSVLMQLHIDNICSVTSETIGDNMLDPSGELPTTSKPTSLPPTLAPVTAPPTFSPTVGPTSTPTQPTTVSPSKEPTVQPSTSAKPTGSPVNNVPSLIAPPRGVENDGNGNKKPGGLGPEVWAGIGIAAAAVVALLFCACFALIRRPKIKELADERTLGKLDQKVHGQELAISNGEQRVSPANTASSLMTPSDTGSIVSGVYNNRSGPYYGNNTLLPELPDGESMLVSANEPGASTNPGSIEEGMAVRSPGTVTNMPTPSTRIVSNNVDASLTASDISRGRNDLNQAIQSGNWEAVATSAARQNESTLSSAVQNVD